MAMSGRKTITIKAPVMITSNKVAVWMDEKWMHDFFDFIAEQKFQISGMNHMQNKIKLTFVDAKECTLFGLKYAGRKK
jgi:hypothetical protein